MPHTELTSRAEYETAIADTSKPYVLIFVYENEVHPKAEERSEQHAATTSNYKVDIAKNQAAKEGLKITSADVPAVVIYKGGSEVKRILNVNAEKAEEIGTFLSS